MLSTEAVTYPDAGIGTAESTYSAGDTVKVSGKDWTGDDEVRIALRDGDGNVVDESTVTPDSDGVVRATFDLPYSAGGAYSVRAKGQTSERVATADLSGYRAR